MTTEPDFYAILGVGRDASQADISSAYRRLVRDHHPDTTSDPSPLPPWSGYSRPTPSCGT